MRPFIIVAPHALAIPAFKAGWSSCDLVTSTPMFQLSKTVLASRAASSVGGWPGKHHWHRVGRSIQHTSAAKVTSKSTSTHLTGPSTECPPFHCSPLIGPRCVPWRCSLSSARTTHHALQQGKRYRTCMKGRVGGSKGSQPVAPVNLSALQQHSMANIAAAAAAAAAEL